MKTKNILIGLSLLGLIINSSCVDDKGNYDYADVKTTLPVTISGIADTIRVQKGGTLSINPVVENTDGNNYVYSWHATNAETAGALPKKFELSDSKNLDLAVVTFDPGPYLLNFMVRDADKDIYLRKQVYLIVSATDVTAGWYVLKDINNETDFDYINNQDELYADVLLNIASPLNSRLKGTAVYISYQNTRYYHQVKNEDGTITTLANQTALHVLSSVDIKTFNAKTLEVFKNLEDIFYEPQQDVHPKKICMALFYDSFLLNNDKVYSIYGMSANVGKFGAPKTGFYSLHSDWIPSYLSVVVFDLDSRTFYYVDGYGANLLTFQDNGPNESNMPGFSLTNMDATVVSLLSGIISAPATGFAIMKNINIDEYYLANFSLSTSLGPFPLTSFDTIPSGNKMPTAPVKAAPRTGNFVYFADGNKLSVYKNASGLTEKEVVLKEFPTGETISSISNVYQANKFNYLAVLTNSASGWKLYLLNVIGAGNPELEPTPAKIFQGTGTARYFMYRN
jgi:hypothetical protein